MSAGPDQSIRPNLNGLGPPARRDLRPQPESLVWEPARGVISIAAAYIFIASFLPWATASGVAGPASFAPITDASDGLLLMVFAGFLLAWTLRRGVAESASRTIQLLGPLAAFACVLLWITTERATRDQIDQWRQLGWTGSETLVVPLTLAIMGIAFLATVWIDRRRSALLRRQTGGLLGEWQITRASLVQLLGGVLGGAIGAGGCLAIGVILTNGWSYAALLFVLLCAFGLIFGAQLGATIGRSLARRYLPT